MYSLRHVGILLLIYLELKSLDMYSSALPRNVLHNEAIGISMSEICGCNIVR